MIPTTRIGFISVMTKKLVYEIKPRLEQVIFIVNVNLASEASTRNEKFIQLMRVRILLLFLL